MPLSMVIKICMATRNKKVDDYDDDSYNDNSNWNI